MPLLFKRNEQYYKIGIWQIEEPLHKLYPLVKEDEIQGIKNYHSHIKQKQTLALRVLLQEIKGCKTKIIYDNNGKPHLEKGREFISFSHTDKYAACILHKNEDCGIDIQLIDNRLKKLKEKYIEDNEEKIISFNTKKNFGEINILTLIWCAKETLYKIKGKKMTSFKKNAQIESIKGTVSSGLIVSRYKSEVESFKREIYYEKIHDHYLLYTL